MNFRAKISQMAISPEGQAELQQIQERKEARRKSQESFLNNLYVRLLNKKLKQKGSKLLAEFDSQMIESWVPATAQPGGHPSLSVDIEKAVLLKTRDQYFALALGVGHRSQYDYEKTLGLQFGALPVSKHGKELFESENVSLQDLRLLFFQRMFSYGSGEFYIEERFNHIEIDCWADGFLFGGKNINSWPEEKKMTLDGINACIEIVERTVRNAFIGE